MGRTELNNHGPKEAEPVSMSDEILFYNMNPDIQSLADTASIRQSFVVPEDYKVSLYQWSFFGDSQFGPLDEVDAWFRLFEIGTGLLYEAESDPNFGFETGNPIFSKEITGSASLLETRFVNESGSIINSAYCSAVLQVESI